MTRMSPEWKPVIARTAVSSVSYGIDRPYDYRIPESMSGQVVPGVRVLVPFGRGNRRTEAMVLSLAGSTEHEPVKDIIRVLDEEPVLSREMINLILRIRDTCFCTFYDVLKAVLPAGMWFRLEQKIRLAAGTDPDEPGLQLSDRERSILSALEKPTSLLELEEKLRSETLDVTLPGKRRMLGNKHPMSILLDDIKEIFLGMGFEIAEGPEVETAYYNFTALNTPEGHPARDMQDTFYFSDDVLLRTQTSSVQIRVMEKRRPPIRIIAPGRVYRKDEIDATHSPMFHQIEGLVVDKGITMGDLKGTLDLLFKQLYGQETRIRFRPHHFPFTEPSAEVDLMCFACHGKGCRICKGEGWIEMLGCGMVQPRVLEYCNIDPDIYTGFAFGLGTDRMTMQRYKINDMRLFFENDIRFLSQF